MMSDYGNTSNELDRTTIVALARDNETKSAFIFNSSAGLREPSNEYKYLLEFFEITLRDINRLVTLNGEYDFGGFSYKIYEELPYANHYNRDQKAINVVKKRYIDEYNDNDTYPLYNRTLNEKAKAELSEKHNGNIIKLYNELHYKRLLEYYKGLDDLYDYDAVCSYINNNERRIGPEVKTNDVSRRYFSGDFEAGIELLIRKRGDMLLFQLSRCNKIEELKNDFRSLLNAYKVVMQIEDSSRFDFDTNLLATLLYNDYYNDITPVLTMLAEKSRDIVSSYFRGKDNSEIIKELNGMKSWLRLQTKEWLMSKYIEETDLNKKKRYLYALYEKQIV